MRRIILVATLMLSVAPVLAAPTTPTDFGALFCRASLADNMAPIEALLTPELTDIAHHALDLNDEIQAAYPDEKPPLGDGLPWRSWTDAASTCVVEGIREGSPETRVTIRYGFADAPGADYSDTLLITDLGGGNWRLTDIEMEGGARFRDILETAFDQ